jgi:hypothetical protein
MGILNSRKGNSGRLNIVCEQHDGLWGHPACHARGAHLLHFRRRHRRRRLLLLHGDHLLPHHAGKWPFWRLGIRRCAPAHVTSASAGRGGGLPLPGEDAGGRGVHAVPRDALGRQAQGRSACVDFNFCRHGSPSCWWGIEGGMLWVGNLIELQHIIYIIYYW